MTISHACNTVLLSETYAEAISSPLAYLTTRNCSTLLYAALHYSTLHSTSFHYFTLHYTTLHCTVMHCTHLGEVMLLSEFQGDVPSVEQHAAVHRSFGVAAP